MMFIQRHRPFGQLLPLLLAVAVVIGHCCLMAAPALAQPDTASHATMGVHGSDAGHEDRCAGAVADEHPATLCQEQSPLVKAVGDPAPSLWAVMAHVPITGPAHGPERVPPTLSFPPGGVPSRTQLQIFLI